MTIETAREEATITAEIPLPGRTRQTYRSTPPRRSRLVSLLRGLRTTVVVLILLAAAVAGGRYVVQHRLAARAYVELDHAVLTARPVPVGTIAAGTVDSVSTAPQKEVVSGQELARLTVSGPEGKPVTQVLRSPIDGMVSEVNVPSGGVATPGQPVLTLYDPAQLTFRASASVAELRRLRLGMTARVTARGLGAPITTRLDRVMPRVGAGTDREQGFIVVFAPQPGEIGAVRSLVPGLPFTATVDTRTAGGGAPAIRSAT